MRKDVKTGMLAGTVLCFVGVVWFCAKQQIITAPLIKFESQSLVAPQSREPEKSESSVPLYNVNSDSSAEAKPTAETSIIHTVTQGQTLSDISKIYYNTPSGWKKIYEANKQQLPQGPDTIKAGMRLIVPQ